MEHDDTLDWLPAIPADDNEAPAEPFPAAKWAKGVAYVPRHRRWRLPWAPVAFAGLLLLVLAAGGTAAWAAHNTPETAALPPTAPTAPYSAPTAPPRPSVAPSTPVPSATAVATPATPTASPVPSPTVPPADTADTVVCTWVMGTGDCPSYSWEIQPTIIGFFSYMSYSISDITWSGYGTGLATGQGTASMNNCVPDCGNGTITTAPVTFTVQNLVPWNGGLAYDTITVPSGEYMLLTEGS